MDILEKLRFSEAMQVQLWLEHRCQLPPITVVLSVALIFRTGRAKGLFTPSDTIWVFMLDFASSLDKKVLTMFVNLLDFWGEKTNIKSPKSSIHFTLLIKYDRSQQEANNWTVMETWPGTITTHEYKINQVKTSDEWYLQWCVLELF